MIALLPDTIRAGPIVLHRWRFGDVEAVVETVSASIDGLRVWMPWANQPVTTDSYASVLRGFDVAFDDGAEFGFAMFEPQCSAVVGGCGLHLRHGPAVAEIGYWVRTDRQRRGYATAAAQALTTAGFRFLDHVDEIHITMDKANVASAGIPLHLGYRLATEEDRDVLA